jgi:hypothetical protein
MPKVAAKHKQGNGESEEEKNSHRVHFPRSMVVAKLLVVPLVVTPLRKGCKRSDSGAHACTSFVVGCGSGVSGLSGTTMIAAAVLALAVEGTSVVCWLRQRWWLRRRWRRKRCKRSVGNGNGLSGGGVGGSVCIGGVGGGGGDSTCLFFVLLLQDILFG